MQPTRPTLSVAVPSLDLRAQFREVEADVRAAMDRVLASQRVILGAEGEALEREVAAYSGAEHAVALSSGTDAVLVGLMALGVGPGDAVVTRARGVICCALVACSSCPPATRNRMLIG